MTVDYSGMVENLKSDLKKAINKTNETLKPCPFCGGEAIVETEKIGKEQLLYAVGCSDRECVSQGRYYTTVESAINAWNTRKPVENVIERLEKEMELAEKEMAECTFKGMPFYDTQNGYATAMYNAIEFIKEEVG